MYKQKCNNVHVGKMYTQPVDKCTKQTWTSEKVEQQMSYGQNVHTTTRHIYKSGSTSGQTDKNNELMGKTVCVHCGQAGKQADKWTNEQKSPDIDNVVHMAVDRCDHKCGKLYKVNK